MNFQTITTRIRDGGTREDFLAIHVVEMFEHTRAFVELTETDFLLCRCCGDMDHFDLSVYVFEKVNCALVNINSSQCRSNSVVLAG